MKWEIRLRDFSDSDCGADELSATNLSPTTKFTMTVGFLLLAAGIGAIIGYYTPNSSEYEHRNNNPRSAIHESVRSANTIDQVIYSTNRENIAGRVDANNGIDGLSYKF